jgi:hypothetical protein
VLINLAGKRAQRDIDNRAEVKQIEKDPKKSKIMQTIFKDGLKGMEFTLQDVDTNFLRQNLTSTIATGRDNEDDAASIIGQIKSETEKFIKQRIELLKTFLKEKNDRHISKENYNKYVKLAFNDLELFDDTNTVFKSQVAVDLWSNLRQFDDTLKYEKTQNPTLKIYNFFDTYYIDVIRQSSFGASDEERLVLLGLINQKAQQTDMTEKEKANIRSTLQEVGKMLFWDKREHRPFALPDQLSVNDIHQPLGTNICYFTTPLAAALNTDWGGQAIKGLFEVHEKDQTHPERAVVVSFAGLNAKETNQPPLKITLKGDDLLPKKWDNNAPWVQILVTAYLRGTGKEIGVQGTTQDMLNALSWDELFKIVDDNSEGTKLFQTLTNSLEKQNAITYRRDEHFVSVKQIEGKIMKVINPIRPREDQLETVNMDEVFLEWTRTSGGCFTFFKPNLPEPQDEKKI